MIPFRCPFCLQWLKVHWFINTIGTVKDAPGGNRIEWKR